MKISDTLRQAAFMLLNNGEKYRLSDRPRTSPYICDNVSWFPNGKTSIEFLNELGMDCGMFVFGYPNWNNDVSFTRETQHERMAWLFFAADLADEWGVE